MALFLGFGFKFYIRFGFGSWPEGTSPNPDLRSFQAKGDTCESIPFLLIWPVDFDNFRRYSPLCRRSPVPTSRHDDSCSHLGRFLVFAKVEVRPRTTSPTLQPECDVSVQPCLAAGGHQIPFGNGRGTRRCHRDACRYHGFSDLYHFAYAQEILLRADEKNAPTTYRITRCAGNSRISKFSQ